MSDGPKYTAGQTFAFKARHATATMTPEVRAEFEARFGKNPACRPVFGAVEAGRIYDLVPEGDGYRAVAKSRKERRARK